MAGEPFRLEFGVTEPEGRLSSGRRRTMRNNARLARGVHPNGIELLKGPEAHTCGDCARSYWVKMGGKFFKCGLNDSRSEATDIRVKWPACAMWLEPKK